MAGRRSSLIRIACAAALLLGLVGVYAWSRSADPAPQPATVASGGPASQAARGAEPIAQRRNLDDPLVGGAPARSAPLPPPSSEEYRNALARAYAYAGARADGYDAYQDRLDDMALALLPVAESLLPKAPLRRGPGLPSTTELGSMQITAPPALLAAAADAPRFGEGPEPIPADRVAATMAAADTATRPVDQLYQRTRAGVTMVQPGQWADIQMHPPTHALSGMVVGNGSAGEYVIRVDAEDFSTVRLDGAMIVPGRFYRVRNGSVHVSSRGPAHITIRPLSAAVVYVEAPTAFPPAAG